ncbi:hypothetical protein LguiA_020333 [Lonicera macranthoides]
MASTLFLLVLVLISTLSSLSALPTSTISAAPALLPNPPLSSPSPTLSPDISPLFPSPAGDGLSPTESSLPIIPSSPSPPNPDDMVAASGPGMAFPPSESMPTSSSVPLNVQFGTLSSSMVMGLSAFWFLQLSFV